MSHFLSYLNLQHSSLSFYCSLARFFMKECYAMIYPYTTEIYSTLVRTLGFGWSSGIGRMSSFLMPFILFPLLEMNPKFPFLVFFIFMGIASIASYTFPYDTTNRPLDKPHEEPLLELKEKVAT